MHQEVQGNAFCRQHRAGIARDAGDRLAWSNLVTIGNERLESDGWIDQAKGGLGERESRHGAVFTAVQFGGRRLFRADRGIGGDVAGAAKILQQRVADEILDHQRRQLRAQASGHRCILLSRPVRRRCGLHP